MKKTRGESGAQVRKRNQQVIQDVILCLLFILVISLCQYCLNLNISRWTYILNSFFILTDRAAHKKDGKVSKGKSQK